MITQRVSKVLLFQNKNQKGGFLKKEIKNT
jgi:hypothetical protein